MTQFKKDDKVQIVKVYNDENHRLDGRDATYIKSDGADLNPHYVVVDGDYWWVQEVKALNSGLTEPTTVGAVVEDSDGDLWVRNSAGTWDAHPDSFYTFKNWSWERLNDEYPVARVVSGHEPTVAVKDVVAVVSQWVVKSTKESILRDLGIKPTKKVVRATIKVEVEDDELEGWDELRNNDLRKGWLNGLNYEASEVAIESFEVIEK